MNGLTNGWIHELARSEASPEADALYSITRAQAPAQAIEESTVEFLTDLRADFQEYVHTFNSLSEGGKRFSEIKIFSLTQGAADFMLYRNGIKLIVANTSQGVIQLAYEKHVVGGAAADFAIPEAQEILAQLGAFGSVHWMVRSERVDSEQTSKHLFAEFTRITREQKKARPNQKVLLEQIKALLHEQGMSLE